MDMNIFLHIEEKVAMALFAQHLATVKHFLDDTHDALISSNIPITIFMLLMSF